MLAVLGQVVQQHAGFNFYDKVLHVVGFNLVHLGNVNQHAATDRHGPSGKPGACAPGRDRDIVVITDFHDCGHFLRGAGLDGYVRHAAINRHFVLGIVGVDVIA